MLQRLLPALSSRVPACRLLSVAQSPYSTQPSTDEIGPGPGSRSRSINQAKAAGETSNTSGPESAPARSPDAPADPADLATNRGSDPQEVLRSSSWQAQQAMSSRWAYWGFNFMHACAGPRCYSWSSMLQDGFVHRVRKLDIMQGTSWHWLHRQCTRDVHALPCP